MDRRVSFVIPEVEVRLQPPGGDPLPVTLVELEVERHDDEPVACRATFVLDPEAYLRADREHLFHLDPEVRGPGAAAFRPEGPVTIEARLVDGQLAAAGAAPVQALADAMAGDDDGGVEAPLRLTEAWLATKVTQVLHPPAELGPGTLRSGYRTAHAAAADLDED
jgi:hypothetical protein